MDIDTLFKFAYIALKWVFMLLAVLFLVDACVGDINLFARDFVGAVMSMVMAMVFRMYQSEV